MGDDISVPQVVETLIDSHEAVGWQVSEAGRQPGWPNAKEKSERGIQAWAVGPHPGQRVRRRGVDWNRNAAIKQEERPRWTLF